MKLIPRVFDFPFTLSQENNYWCIAACVEAIFKYYNAELFDQFQFQLSCAVFLKGGFNFSNALSVLNELKSRRSPRFDSFSFENDSLGFDELVSKIKGSIDLGYPIIVSIPVTSGAHMLVFVGYSEDSASFVVYDPGDKLYIGPLFSGKLLLYEKLRELIPDRRDYLLIKKE